MADFQYGGLVEQVTVTATAAGTTTLTNTSTQIQVFTGSSNQTVVLPNATTYTTIGPKFEIFNQSTGSLTIETNGGSTLTTISANSWAYFRLQTNGASAGTWMSAAPSSGSSYTPPTSEVWYVIANGYGSGGTTTRRWTTNESTVGSDITYNSSATNGDSFTINTTGIYTVYYADEFGGANFMGIVVNSSAGSYLSTNIVSIPYSSTQGNLGYVRSAGGGNIVTSISLTHHFTAGQIITFQTDGAASGGAGGDMVRITRIA
jgi:hypothetical protein